MCTLPPPNQLAELKLPPPPIHHTCYLSLRVTFDDDESTHHDIGALALYTLPAS